MRKRGFSLIEIMLVLGLATVILAIGVPAFIRGERRMQARDAAQQLSAALRLAVTQARQAGDGVAFNDRLPSGAADGRYQLFKVQGGRVDRTPVAQGDTAFTPSGITVLQVSSVLDPSTQQPASVSQSGAAAVDPSGRTVGAVMLVQGQSLVFTQDGVPLQANNTPVEFDFGNGYGAWRVTLKPSGEISTVETTSP